MESKLKNEFEGKTILITGGVGSIGSQLAERLLEYKPHAIRILDTDESGLFEFVEKVKNNKDKLRLLVGNIRDVNRVNKALEKTDIVFHTAALKHVSLSEYNPFETVKTNVIGTQNIIDACLKNNVKKMIFISTDKAVNPLNVMGTTKLLGEKLTIAANYHKGDKRTIFSIVRFGNVLASRGSVIPLFREQIKNGGPVTVTDPNMTRFIMSNEKAIELVMKSTVKATGGEIFVFRMPKVRIIDLSEVMIEKLSPIFGFDASKIKTEIIGAKPGEKIHEQLITENEKKRVKTIDDELLMISPEINLDSGIYYGSLKITKEKKGEEESKNTNKEIVLNKKEIRELLDHIYK